MMKNFEDMYNRLHTVPACYLNMSELATADCRRD